MISFIEIQREHFMRCPVLTDIEIFKQTNNDILSVVRDYIHVAAYNQTRRASAC